MTSPAERPRPAECDALDVVARRLLAERYTPLESSGARTLLVPEIEDQAAVDDANPAQL
jgi:hypothetical protein